MKSRMVTKLTRRETLAGVAALLSTRAFAGGAENALSAIAARHKGRLGFAALDSGTGRRLSLSGDEHFALCSTFKFLAAAALLHRVDAGAERLDRRIVYSKADLLDYAPVTSRHVAEGMTLAELCTAAIAWSDNTAGNLILAALGGPEAVTRYLRSLGDEVTRVDRTEPTVNDVEPDDPRDTTTPHSMLGLMRTLLLDRALSSRSRAQLLAWLASCQTGQHRLAAGLPSGWRIGDKTGTGPKGEANDIAIIYPPRSKPILIAAYYQGREERPEARDAALADAARVIVHAFGAA